MRNIVEQDLSDTGRLLRLFDDARSQNLIDGSEASRLRFVALAVHARRYATTNPPGLFRSLLKSRRWNYITNDDEDIAVQRLKKHSCPDAAYLPPAPAKKQIPEPQLSDDARFVQLLMRTLSNRGISGDPFEHLARLRPQWDRQRWEAAKDALRPRFEFRDSAMRVDESLESVLGRLA